MKYSFDRFLVSFLNVAVSGLLLTATVFKFAKIGRDWRYQGCGVKEASHPYHSNYHSYNNYRSYHNSYNPHYTHPNSTYSSYQNYSSYSGNKTDTIYRNTTKFHNSYSHKNSSFLHPNEIKIVNVTNGNYSYPYHSKSSRHSSYPYHSESSRYSSYPYRHYSCDYNYGKLIAGIFSSIFTLIFLSLEFNSLASFYKNNLSMLMKPAGRGIFYISASFLTFDVHYLQIIFTSTISSIGLLMIFVSLLAPSYAIIGSLPCVSDSNQAESVYEPLPVYEKGDSILQEKIMEIEREIAAY